MDTGTLGRQVLSAYGQLNTGIGAGPWGSVSQARLGSQKGAGSELEQAAQPVIFTRLTVSRPKRWGDREELGKAGHLDSDSGHQGEPWVSHGSDGDGPCHLLGSKERD